MATNLGVAASFAEWAFIDTFKLSSPWVSGTPWAPDRDPVWDDGRPLDLDEHGWVRSLLPDQIARTAMLTGPLATRPAGRYVVLYEGRGEMQYTGAATLVESGPGRDVLDVDPSGEIALNVVAVDPDDHLRNIRVIMPGGVYEDDPHTWVAAADPERPGYLSFEEHYDELVFHPDFLKSLEGYASVRFMNWMLTNDSTVAEWGDRPLPDDARWTVDGVPIEVMVDLANRLGFDPWFTLPHLATDDYVREFAGLVASQLADGLTPYVEYSNEVWNTQFAQNEYARDRGTALGLASDPFTAVAEYYALRASEVFTIWEEELGDGFRAVVGSMTSEPDEASRRILESGDMARLADVLAVGGYFGFQANWSSRCDLIAAMSLDDLFAFLEDEEIPGTVEGLGVQAGIADEHGLALAVYEGGQHLRGNNCEGDAAKADQIGLLFDAANRDPRMKDLYLDFFAAVEAAGVDLFAHYTNTGAWTPFGRFGAREYLDQTRAEAPKYDAILTYIEQG